MNLVKFLAISVFLLLFSCCGDNDNTTNVTPNCSKSKSPISVFAFGNTVIVWDYEGDGSLVISSDDGTTWKKKDIVLNLDGDTIYADYVYFYNESLGFAFAGHGGKPYIYKTTNQGDSWALSFKNTASAPDQHDTWDMQFINPDVGFFCNTYEIYKTTNGGTTFSKINLPHQTVSGYDIMPEAFRFFDENFGYVVGNVTYNPNPFKKYNAAYTTDGGNSWQPVEIPWRKDNYQVTEIHSIDISKSDRNQVWVGGYNSQIGGIGGKFHFCRNGFLPSPTWEHFYLPDDPNESNRILQIQIMPNGYIWAHDGQIVYYFKGLDDYPQHWQLEGKFIKNISMLSPDKGWAIAENDIWKYTASKKWEKICK